MKVRGQHCDALPGESSTRTAQHPSQDGMKRQPEIHDLASLMKPSSNIDHCDATPGESSVSKVAGSVPSELTESRDSGGTIDRLSHRGLVDSGSDSQ